MKAEIISIGDEITSGQRLDTNSMWLSGRLLDLGIRVAFHTTVGDDLPDNQRVFSQAIERADVVVATGGLGPTADDLTREALAAVTGRPLRLDEASLAHIRALFARRGRTMPERNVVQAMFPESSRVIPNPHGTAPGIELAVDRQGQSPCYLYALPGVPAEMREMWYQTVEPRLQSILGPRRTVIEQHCVKCFGVGESELEQMLPDIIRRGRVPAVGITASRTILTLRIRAEAESRETCREQIEGTLATIRQSLGGLIFSEQDSDELQHAVVHLLQARQRSLATFETGSGGMLAGWLSDADPQEEVYQGGVIARQTTGGREPLFSALKSAGFSNRDMPFPASIAAQSPEEMAETMRFCATWVGTVLNSDYSLAIGPFPTNTAEAAAPADVWIGLARGQESRALPVVFAGHPDLVRERVVKQALNALRLWLLEEEVS